MIRREEQIGDCRLMLGDCREVLPTLGKVDVVVTDPPYGVNFKYASYKDDPAAHQDQCREWLALFRAISEKVLVFTGIENLFLWERPDWLACWHKPFSVSHSPFGANNWEPIAVYGNPGRNERQTDWFNGTFELLKGVDHPCPKPLAAMLGAITISTKFGQTVLDPFMGSGTTGVACVKLGRKFIGIEIEEKYFDIACRRIEDAVSRPDMFIELAKAEKQEVML